MKSNYTQEETNDYQQKVIMSKLGTPMMVYEIPISWEMYEQHFTSVIGQLRYRYKNLEVDINSVLMKPEAFDAFKKDLHEGFKEFMEEYEILDYMDEAGVEHLIADEIAESVRVTRLKAAEAAQKRKETLEKRKQEEAARKADPNYSATTISVSKENKAKAEELLRKFKLI